MTSVQQILNLYFLHINPCSETLSRSRHNLIYGQTSVRNPNHKSFLFFNSFKLHIINLLFNMLKEEIFFYKICKNIFNCKFYQQKLVSSIITPPFLYHIKHYFC